MRPIAIKKYLISALLTLYKALTLFSQFLPTAFVLRCAAFVGRIVGKFCTKDQQVSIAQLRFAFPGGIQPAAPQPVENGQFDRTVVSLPGSEAGLPPEAFRVVAAKMFHHIGESVGEIMLSSRFLPRRSARGVPEKSRVTNAGDDVIARLLESQSGAVGLSAHFGSFELLGAYLAWRGLKCSVIGRAPNYPLLEQLIQKFRRSYGIDVIWGDKAEAPRQIVEAVRSGRIICALLDQDTKWKSEFSPFFGLQAASPIAPIQLAIRYKLPLFTCFIVRTAPMSHQVHTTNIPYDADDPDAGVKILTIYNERLEALIRSYPEQYIWWHRRWRRRPGVDYTRSPQLLRGTSPYIDWLSSLGHSR